LSTQETIKDGVKEYYGETLKTSSDLQTDACCDTEAIPDYIKSALTKVSDEVLQKYYGCGLTIPTHLEERTVLDLGSGAGRDCFLLSQIVGEKGKVFGVDMTDEQLEVANRNIEYHREKFGYTNNNVTFYKGDLEKLNQVGIQPNSVDVIVSNCVINLVPDKEAVLSQAFDLLKEGGEMYFSDVYCNRRIPQHLVEDKELYGECLSGALYWNDFENLAKKVGFADPRVVESRPLLVSNPRLEKMLAGFNFYSVTYRLFKISDLEPHCEDYGHAITYKGNLPESQDFFKLDDHHVFLKNKVTPVCGNSYKMLNDTRYKDFFDFHGNFDQHFGIFEGCGVTIPYSNQVSAPSVDPGACC